LVFAAKLSDDVKDKQYNKKPSSR